ncbi:MAG: site-specific DNA-methyltransferase [Clostridiales bacterium]|nr:MAG: site-specific DNA-methyltransferase [Clostridiales bacterium]
MGSGTTAIASFNLGRKSIGIDLNSEYKELALTRFF